MQEKNEQGASPEEMMPSADDASRGGGRNHIERRGPRRPNTRPEQQSTRSEQQNTRPEQLRSGGPRRNPSAMRPCPAELTPAPQRQVLTGRPQTSRRFNGEHEPQKRGDGKNCRQPFDGVAHLYEVIQVRLVRTQRLVEVNTNGLRLGPNTPVLIRVHRNILLATTVGYRHRRVAEINSLPFIVRVATEEDRALDAENARIEKRAHELASEYAIAQNLQMKVLSADLSHDHKNITINFASDVRVDFREMVAYLAGQLKLRVEMYQLGLRNGTGIICGLGSCGQLLCCGRFLGQFDPIAVKQLRAQGLATNPKRISGVCGRLYCCMSYEYCDYMKERRTLPKKGRRVFSQWGIGRVTDIDMLREEVVVTYENGETQRLTPNDFLPATDEIVAKVEAGEYEFPLEPAKFYLNADPNSAAESETQTRAIKPAASGRRLETATKKGVPPRKMARPAPVAAKENTEPAEKTAHTRRRRTSPKHPVPESVKTAAAAAIAAEKRERSERREPAAAAMTAPRHAGAEPAATHHARMTRKVKAHQANLEDAMNMNAENRNSPSRPSRRRFSPMTPAGN